MARAAFEVAGIFHRHGAAYRAQHRLPLEQHRLMRAIEICRTAALGGHVEHCGHCPYQRISYNSCHCLTSRNRHCPKCQNRERGKWLARRKGELLPVEYFHVVGETSKRLTAVLSMIPQVRFVPVTRGWNGRPAKDRLAIASAFVAKAVLNLGTTRQVIDRLKNDEQLRRLCGWNQAKNIPHEATFSRAFAEFAAMELPQFVHEALIRDTQKERLIGHIARDSTAIEVRERFPETKKKSGKAKSKPKHKKKTGPKKKGEISAKEMTRLERQNAGMTVDAMLAELPKNCSIGTKTSSKGHQQYWRGYKLHLDVADGQIPISAVLTGASVHDSQVAIPLATITAGRVTSLYDLMDAAYDAKAIKEHSRKLGHVPIVDPAERGRTTKNVIVQPKLPRQFSWAEKERFKERTSVERVNARIKDNFGGRTIRVRGAVKVMAHLMFGVLALTVEQLMRLTT